MPAEQYHPISSTHTYATVVLPLAVPKPYTYIIPETLIAEVQFGIRVEVQVGAHKRYTALVIEIHSTPPEAYTPKPLIAVVDESPIITKEQVHLWQWMASYYCCTIGEVMHASLPAHLKLASETRLLLSPIYQEDHSSLNDQDYLIAEALHLQGEISIEDVRGILDKEAVYPIIKRLLDQKVIYLKEDLKEKYKPKTVGCVRLAEPYASDSTKLSEAFELVNRATRQTEALLAYIQLSKRQPQVRKQEIYELAQVDASVLKAMASKGIFEIYEREVSRLGSYEEETIVAELLTEQQQRAISEINAQLTEKQAVLLHGVTGSGKTRVYVELIQDVLDRGGQALYLLPEIALTTQIVERLQRIFGDKIVVYHSRLNNNERVELWNRVISHQPVVLGARSAMLLPFQQLELVIIDEEHDYSFKQSDPNPRYQGRDTALFLAQLYKAKVILGTATPSIETYFNAIKGKYGLVEMPLRVGGLEMPEIVIANAKAELKQGTLHSHFTSALLDALRATLERGEQAILFQNRRGYAPTYRCTACDWHAECINCDVSLTYHKFHHLLKCHYCGYQTPLPQQCPACGNRQLTLQGFGTEKIEDELKIYLPEARIGRMDLDAVRTRNAHSKLINDFEEQRLDILVGTQMVTKGLDFENVALVGVLSADQLLQFPDFRAAERAFQLMLQVSGRAGRKHRRGQVIIQAFNVSHPVLREVIANDYIGFFQRELLERHEFSYPPYTRLIKLTLKHKKPQTLNDGGKIFTHYLKNRLGEWVIGPAVPYVARLREWYLLDLLVKLPRDPKKLNFAKATIQDAIHHLQQSKGLSGVRVNVDVDPY